MNTANSLIKQYALAIFCALTITYTFAATLLPLQGEVIPVVMVFIPALMAIFLTALSEGMAGARSLLGKLTQWRFSLKWVVIALSLALMMRLTISFLALVLGMIPAIQLRPGPLAQFVVLALILFIFAIPEELGWRGYALSILLEHHSSWVVGITTSCAPFASYDIRWLATRANPASTHWVVCVDHLALRADGWECLVDQLIPFRAEFLCDCQRRHIPYAIGLVNGSSILGVCSHCGRAGF